MVSREFWRKRKVFLTGHTGFKGSWLALWLQELGAEVTGFALAPSTKPALFEVAKIGLYMTDLRGDVRDRSDLQRALAIASPDVVFHLAAQSLVRPSYEDPVGTFATNVMGTVNLLEAIRPCTNVRAIVNVTSDKCYANREWAWGYRENESLGGLDPYSSSKACAELVSAAYRASYFSVAAGTTRLATARAGNVIGGGDWALDRLVPDVIRSFVAKRPVTIRNPLSVRPWQHVLDPLAGYMQLAERLFSEGQNFDEAWNFGPWERDARPVAWIADRMTAAWGDGASWLSNGSKGPHEASMLRLDCAKARSRLDWAPRWSLDEALGRVISWHRAHLDGVDMRSFSLAQIAEFSCQQTS